MLLYLSVLLGLAGWRFLPRPWHPTITIRTARYAIESTATQEQTDSTARSLGLLHTAYSNRFCAVGGFRRDHPPLRVRLFKDRDEFRWVNPGLGWAEAYYRPPICRAYFPQKEKSPYHWMLHEAVHQLNHEVAGFELAKWLEEGVSEYFSTSQLHTNELALGCVDPNTYPVWWLEELATAETLEENLTNGSVIPLRAIITNRGGPSMNRHFNLYYLHWWTLTHFIFESPRHRDQALTLMERGGGLTAFEELIGPVDEVQAQWHDYVRRMKAAIEGIDAEFLRTGRIPQYETAP